MRLVWVADAALPHAVLAGLAALGAALAPHLHVHVSHSDWQISKDTTCSGLPIMVSFYIGIQIQSAAAAIAPYRSLRIASV